MFNQVDGAINALSQIVGGVSGHTLLQYEDLTRDWGSEPAGQLWFHDMLVKG